MFSFEVLEYFDIVLFTSLHLFYSSNYQLLLADVGS